MVQRESLSRTLWIQSVAGPTVRGYVDDIKFIWLFPCVRERRTRGICDKYPDVHQKLVNVAFGEGGEDQVNEGTTRPFIRVVSAQGEVNA